MNTRALFLLLEWNSWFFVCSRAFSEPLVLNYKELEDLGAACPPSDTCRNISARDYNPDLHCSCEPSCARYGRCCIDSPHIEPPRKKVVCNRRFWKYTVSSCDPKWSGVEDIRRQCEEEAVDERDLATFTPMTNAISGYTYKNYFCAFCNDDHEGAIFWDTDISTYHSSSSVLDRVEILNNMRYNEQSGKWESKIKEEVLNIDIDLLAPRRVNFLVEYCNYDIISECVEAWQNLEVKMKCEAYMAPIWFGYSKFRNIHCALCNYKNVDDSACEPVLSGGSSGGYGGGYGGGANFMHLVRVKGTKCPVNKIFNVTSQILKTCGDNGDRPCCHRVGCTKRGQVVQGNNCVAKKSE